MRIFSIISVSFAAIALTMAAPVFAESAPVYDADAIQFDDNADQGSDLPPPSPGQENAFVPSQSVANEQQSTAATLGSERLSVEQRMQRVEQQVNGMQSSDLAARLNALQDQVQALQGQVEQLLHQLQQVQNTQKAQYSDLDKRLSQQQITTKQMIASTNSDEADAPQQTDNNKTKSKPIAKVKVVDKVSNEVKPKSKQSQSVVNQPNVAEEQAIYQTAYNMIKAKKYEEAVDALQGMLRKYPSGQFASNAHYWLGELYGLMNKNDLALNEFSAVVKSFPDSPRVSDAQLKVGLILASQSKWAEAKAAFKTVINQYPGTASARLASDNLKQLQQMNH